MMNAHRCGIELTLKQFRDDFDRQVRALAEVAHRPQRYIVGVDPATVTPDMLKPSSILITEDVPQVLVNWKDPALLTRPRNRFTLDKTISSKEATMAKNPLTSKAAKLSKSWGGKANFLSHTDIGKVVQVTTRDGATVKDQLIALAADERGVYARLRHTQPTSGEFDFAIANDYFRIDPESKVVVFDVEWKDEA